MVNKKQIRTLLRKSEQKFISVRSTMALLKWKKKEAIELLDYLETQGYIELSVIDEGLWQISMRGRLLANSALPKVFKTDTLNRNLDALVDRAREVNQSTRFPDCIICIKIISSYPIEEPSTAIRIAYCLKRKAITDEEYEAAASKLRANYNGNFGNMFLYYTYPARAIARFLQSKSKVLKLNEYNHEALNQLKGHILFQQ